MYAQRLLRQASVLTLLVLLLVGCGFLEAALPPASTEAPPEGQPTELPATPTPAPPLPTPTPSGPPPAPGTGNVMGRILWNGEPVTDLELKLCENVSMVGGCSGPEFSTRTDEAGSYLFADIAPGEYGLVAHALDTERWLYVTTGLGPGARKYTVAADQILNVGDHHIYKFDLRFSSPSDGGQVDTATPTLAWEPYPDAAYYELYLTPEHGSALFVNHRVDENQITLATPLLTCSHTWDVEAFNARGIKIAETDGYYDFFVRGQPNSCYVQITAPLDGVTVSGSGLALSWEAHPLAASYKILMWNDTEPGRPHVLDFVEVREPSYTFSEMLAPARYVWSVTGYDEFAEEIAGSEVYDFTVSGQ